MARLTRPMRRLLTGAACAAAALALAGCGTMRMPWSGASAQERAAACGETSFAVYFEPESAALASGAETIIQQGVGPLETCRAAGGELVRATVRAYPDEAMLDGPDATRLVYARTEAVVAALVGAGLPPTQVVGYDHRANPTAVMSIMRRQAEVKLEMR
ncbi:MAG: hypothetical protein GC206_04405 [Alphaproteobacteria bacterium]|nr:hypothetical protein [Alphaproteobacteria bacterium]